MKNVILVPKGKSPFELLVEMGERTKDAWIFIHSDVFERLRKICAKEEYLGSGIWKFDRFDVSTCLAPKNVTLIVCEFVEPWNTVTYIKSMDIEFDSRVDIPNEIIFLKMAD